MEDIVFTSNIGLKDAIIYGIKIYFISIFACYIVLKISNNTKIFKKKAIFINICTLIISIVCALVNFLTNSFNSTVILILSLASVISKIINLKIGYSIILTTISVSINYIIFFISVAISFIPNKILSIKNDFISLISIVIIHAIFLYFICKIKKFKNGLIFVQNSSNNEYLDIIILNISVIILFSAIVLANFEIKLTISFTIAFIIFSIIMFITIQKSLQLYYKQKLLIQDLNETKEEKKKKNEEIKELEQENLSFSKTSHSIAHKQKALEYKLNEILLKSEIAEEIDIRDKVEKLRKEITKNKAQIELTKTNIEEIDDMLKYMQSECTKNDIEFDLKIQGNIYHMVNNIIEKEDLEILLADHIKNAIIAIQNSDNTNKTILVKLGIINGVYSLHIYDSGIEFEVETLKNLGKKPSTTHADQGGTGMGFMNTFDTLKKYKASLIINEYGKPSKENYTKSISIEFDKKNEYKVISYRKQCEILSYLGSK